MLYALLVFALALTVMGGVLVIAQFLSLFTGAPFVPTRPDRVAAMVAMAGIRSGERVADLGSGDGRLVVAAAEAGADAEGYEANPLLALGSALLLRRLRLRHRARIRADSYRGRDLRHLDAAFLYVLPAEMARLERWLPAAMKPGSRVVVHAFPFPTWTPEETRGSLYRYRVPDPPA